MSSLIYNRSLAITTIALNSIDLQKVIQKQFLHSSVAHNSKFVRLSRLTYTASYHDIVDCYVLTILRDGNIKNDLQIKI